MCFVIFSLITTSLFAQSSAPTRYTTYSYMKVAPEKENDYLKLEKAWKKLHQAKKKAGQLDDWSLAQVISPSGSSTSYNYVTRNSFAGDAQYAAMYDENYMPANWQSLLTVDEIGLVLRTDEIRTIVKNETWIMTDMVWADDATSTAKVFVFNYFKIPEGKTRENHTKVEKEIWKPVHEARVKAGTMKGWVLLDLMLPFGSSLPYSSATVDAYTDMKQFLMPFPEDYFKKVHPNKDVNDLMKQTDEAANLVRGEVRFLVDRLAW